MMRAIFDQRPHCSVTPLYYMWGEEPIEASLHKMVFSLHYSMWLDITSPTVKISKAVAKDKNLVGNYWILMVSKLCVLYDLPPPTMMWDLETPSKNHWKKFLYKIIDDYWSKIMKNRIEKLKILRFIGEDYFKSRFRRTSPVTLTLPVLVCPLESRWVVVRLSVLEVVGSFLFADFWLLRFCSNLVLRKGTWLEILVCSCCWQLSSGLV